MSLEDLITASRYSGLDGVCITDHNSMGIAGSGYLKTVDFPVFIGVEMSTPKGDIVAIGLDSLPDYRPTAQEFADFVAEQNGFCFAAHPFRYNGWGIGPEMQGLSNLDGVEVLNGHDSPEENDRAMLECQRLGLIPVGGSDAHIVEAVGKCATWFGQSITCARELVEALKAGSGRPVYRAETGRYIFLE
jgi:predicted metal-dependent phosphoesterase TrpH